MLIAGFSSKRLPLMTTARLYCVKKEDEKNDKGSVVYDMFTQTLPDALTSLIIKG